MRSLLNFTLLFNHRNHSELSDSRRFESSWASLIKIDYDIDNVSVHQVIEFLDIWKNDILSWIDVICKKDCSFKKWNFFHDFFDKNLIDIFNCSVSMIWVIQWHDFYNSIVIYRCI